jgi:hypothetical protein
MTKVPAAVVACCWVVVARSGTMAAWSGDNG